MTHSVDTTQPLSSAIPVITQWVHIQSGQGDKDRGYAWAQQHGPPLIKAHLAMTIAECQQQRPTLSAPCGTIYPEWSASYLVTGWLHWTASIMREKVFCSYWNIHSGYRLAFPTFNASVKTTNRGHHHGILYSIASDQEAHFTQKNLVMLIHRYYHVLLLSIRWASECQAPAPTPSLGSHCLWSYLSVYLPGYLSPASRLCVTMARPSAAIPSVIFCWSSWTPTLCLSGLPPHNVIIILSK